MSRSSLQKKNINVNIIACELLVKRVDTFSMVLYRNQLPVNFTLHFAEMQFSSYIKNKKTLFGNYDLKCNIVERILISFNCFSRVYYCFFSGFLDLPKEKWYDSYPDAYPRHPSRISETSLPRTVQCYCNDERGRW